MSGREEEEDYKEFQQNGHFVANTGSGHLHTPEMETIKIVVTQTDRQPVC